MSNVDDVTRESTGVSRRTLVRAGAHAAWVVPAVTVISAAPAMAISASTGSLVWSGTGTGHAGTAAWSAKNATDFTLSGAALTATSAQGTTTTVTLVVTFPILITENGGGSQQSQPTGGLASGWSSPTFGGAGTSANPYTASYTKSVTGTSSGVAVLFSPAAYNVRTNVANQSLNISVSAAGYTTPGTVSVPIS